jgi:hypothetical protein
LKSDGDSGYHLVEWELSGSLDGNTSVVLDQRHTKDLDGQYITNIFGCNAEPSFPNSYRYIRLHQTGQNSCARQDLELANKELFGSMINSEHEWMTIARN